MEDPPSLEKLEKSPLPAKTKIILTSEKIYKGDTCSIKNQSQQQKIIVRKIINDLLLNF